MEFVLLCSSMFGIALFGFALLLIDDRRLAMQLSQHLPKFFCQCLAVALFTKLFDCQSFLLYGNYLNNLINTALFVYDN